MSLSEAQIALFARQILVIGGKGQEQLCDARARAAPESIVGRYLAAGGTPLSDDGDPLCASCVQELGDDPLVALTFQQRVLTGRCPEAPVKSHASITELVGNTPLYEIRCLAAEAPGVRILAKCEFFNPGGSVKNRAALQMLTEAKAKPGQVMLDSTSGNTGIALAWIGAAMGLKIALVMPSNVSAARKRITKAYGAELIFSDPLEGSDGAIRHARQLLEQEPGRYHYLDQYSNSGNPGAHYRTTAPEIWRQTEGQVTHFVAGIGTTGTVMGTGKRLKELNPKVQVIAVEPLEALHGLEGLKHLPSSIVPPIYSAAVHDEKLSVATDAGWDMSERLMKDEGLALGHSSGANVAGALEIAKRLAARKEPGVIVTVFPDRADRYFEPKRWEKTFSWP